MVLAVRVEVFCVVVDGVVVLMGLKLPTIVLYETGFNYPMLVVYLSLNGFPMISFSDD